MKEGKHVCKLYGKQHMIYFYLCIRTASLDAIDNINDSCIAEIVTTSEVRKMRLLLH